MKKTKLLLVTFLSGFAAFAEPVETPAKEQNSPSFSGRPFRDQASLFHASEVSRRGGATIRFGLQVMPMVEIIGEGKGTELDKAGQLTYKKALLTGGAGIIIKAELSPYFQVESGINYVRKTYGFNQKDFITEGISGTYDLSIAANQYEFPLLFSFGFGSGRTQTTFFRPVLGLILNRYQYGGKKERRDITTADPDLEFVVRNNTLRDLDNSTSFSSALGVIGFRVLTTRKKKGAIEYGLSYCHDLGEGDKMVVATSVKSKSSGLDVERATTLTLVPQTAFLRFHLAYYLYSSR